LNNLTRTAAALGALALSLSAWPAVAQTTQPASKPAPRGKPPATAPAVLYSIPAKPDLVTPAGTYQAAWLDLRDPRGGRAVKVFVAFRDGRAVQFWSTDMLLPGMAKFKEQNVKLLTDACDGEARGGRIEAQVDLRLISLWAPMKTLSRMRLTLALDVKGDAVTGTWTNTVDGQKSDGEAVGTVAAADPVKQDWPSYFGPNSALRASDYGKPLIADLAQAKPVWRSETAVLSGWGTGADNRYKGRAGFGSLCGGSSSPVVADGRVYLYHYRPVPGDDSLELNDEAHALLDQFKDQPVERDGVRRFFAKRADVVVTCLDAATGATLWESTWPRKQGNYQTHKWRGLNHTPSVAGGVLVVSDYSWGLHAFDARTGELKWTRGGDGDVPGNQGAVGPLIVGDVVVLTTKAATLGVDLQTGAERWKAPAATTARRMTIDGVDRVLLAGDPLRLLDPATGAVVATTPFPGGVEKKGKREIGLGAGANLVCEGPYIVTFETAEKDGKPVGTVVALKATATSIEPAWRSDVSAVMEDGHIGLVIAGGRVYTAFQEAGAFCFDLATGKTVKALPEFKAQSNPIFVAVDDRLLWQPECQHGRQKIQLMDTGPNFGPLGANWRPPHNDTTAYGNMPTANVVADGRLFVRGIDGLYCYDLRAGR
jgi:outer membrane protein assembly factor BamB